VASALRAGCRRAALALRCDTEVRVTTSRLLIRGGTVVTLGEHNRVLSDHDVLVAGEKVATIAPGGTIEAPDARVVHARGMIVMPGLINAHTHFYSTLARGLTKAVPARTFDEVLQHLWWRLDRALTLADVRCSAFLALVDAVRHGTTTLFDHHASPGAVRGSLDVIAGAAREVGVRVGLCYEVSDRDGVAAAQAGMLENCDAARGCRRDPDDYVRSLFGLHASFTLSDATLGHAVELATELDAGFHVHVAEAPSDQERCLAEHGCRIVERLNRFGILGDRTVAAHCVHVDEAEMELLATTGTAVAHCPQSNMNNAVGVADVLTMLGRGGLVGLGTDAVTCDMLEELRAALFVRHLATGDPSAGFLETCGLLLDGNRRIAARSWPGLGLGELREGGAADIALFPYDPPTPLDEATLGGHLLFGISQVPVATSICGGQVLLEGGHLQLDLDETELAVEARARALALWERM
jgi:putative selenium metabolism protein SsnA